MEEEEIDNFNDPWMRLLLDLDEEESTHSDCSTSNSRNTNIESDSAAVVVSHKKGDNKYFGGQSPKRFDVLLGKGKNIQTFTGNARLRQLVDIHLPKYESCDKLLMKAIVVDSIVDAIHESSGQFLKMKSVSSQQELNSSTIHGDIWEEATYEEARTKVAKLFRARRAAAAASTARGKKV